MREIDDVVNVGTEMNMELTKMVWDDLIRVQLQMLIVEQPIFL